MNSPVETKKPPTALSVMMAEWNFWRSGRPERPPSAYLLHSRKKSVCPSFSRLCRGRDHLNKEFVSPSNPSLQTSQKRYPRTSAASAQRSSEHLALATPPNVVFREHELFRPPPKSHSVELSRGSLTVVPLRFVPVPPRIRDIARALVRRGCCAGSSSTYLPFPNPSDSPKQLSEPESQRSDGHKPGC